MWPCNPSPPDTRFPSQRITARLALVLGAAAFLGTTVAKPTHAEGINLSWDECGVAGSSLKTFACNSGSTTPLVLIGSFKPPANVDEFLGTSAELRVASKNLPNWWALGEGQCRSGGLNTDFRFASGGACADFYGREAVGGFLYELGGFGANTARLVIQSAVPFDKRGAVDPAKEYYAFKLLLYPDISSASCPGCEVPVGITLNKIQLFQPLDVHNDPVITIPLDRTAASWQAQVGALPQLQSFAPAGGAPGDVITLRGRNLDGTSVVTFNGNVAAFTVVADSVLEATVPAGTHTGAIELITPFGRSRSSATFVAAPVLETFLPRQAATGQDLAIRGYNLANVTAVKIGGVSAAFQIADDTNLRAVVPVNATDGPIAAINPGGQGASDDFHLGATSGVLDLSWDDCGLAGTALEEFACDRSSGTPFTLVGAFAPPAGVNQLQGLTADLGVYGTVLPDWWKFGSNCRGQGVTTSFDFVNSTHSCLDPWNGNASGATSYDIGYYGVNSARLHVNGGMNGTTAVDARSEYYAFKINVLPSRTSDACDGCNVPVRLVLQQIQLVQPPALAFDPVITASYHRNTVLWQGTPGPLPVIQSFNPIAGAAGTGVDIAGLHLGGAAVVRFGALPAGSFTVLSDSLIHAEAPVDVRTGPIVVKTQFGTGTSATPFVGPPVITSFAPGQAPPGSTVTIEGYNFTLATAVTFNDAPAAFTVTADSHIAAVVPSRASDGFISVINPAGRTTSSDVFHVGADAIDPPKILSFSPAGGVPGTPVSITGLHLSGTNSVRFGPTEVSFHVASDVLVTANVPVNPVIGPLRVATPAGIALSSTPFIVPPVIVSFSLQEVETNDLVAILGRNFTQATSVHFADESAEFHVIADSLIQAIVPAGLPATGKVRVDNIAAGFVSEQSYRLSPHVAEGGLNLAWNDCGAAGDADQTFTCDSNQGRFSLVASFVAPARVTEFLGASAELKVQSKSDQLPDWWQFGLGTCRGSGLSVDYSFTEGPFTCEDFTLGRAAGGFVYEIGQGGPNTARIRIQYAVPIDSRGPLEAGKEYYAFKINLQRTHTTGTQVCEGCSTPVDITLRQIQLFQPQELHNDPTIEVAALNNKVRWQPAHGGPELVPDPSFETSIAGWGPVGGATLDRVGGAHTGAFALQATGPDSAGEFGINDTPNLVLSAPAANRLYRFSAYVRSTSDSLPLQLRVREYANRVRVQTSSTPWLVATPAWKHVQGQVTTLGAGSALDFQIIAAGRSPHSVLQVDDLEVNLQGSEPVLDYPRSLDATPGVPLTFEVKASDPSGEPIHSLVADLSQLPMLHDATFTVDPDSGRGVLRWTPQPEDADGIYDVTFTATSVLDKVRSTEIHVAHVDPYPLVTNPSFEQSAITGWKGYEGAAIERVSSGRTGDWSLSVHEADSTAEYGINDSPNWVLATPAAGIPYRFACWVRANAGTGVALIRVREFQGATKLAATYSSTLPLSPEWRQVIVDHVTRVAGSTLDFQVLCEPGRAGTTFDVDDVTIRPLVALAVAQAARATAVPGLVFERPTVYPNPFRQRAMLGITLARPGPMHVAVFDLSGRRVRTVFEGDHAAVGTHLFDLDGRDDQGHRLGAGLFFYRIESPNGTQQGRFVLLE